MGRTHFILQPGAHRCSLARIVAVQPSAAGEILEARKSSESVDTVDGFTQEYDCVLKVLWGAALVGREAQIAWLDGAELTQGLVACCGPNLFHINGVNHFS